MDFFTFFVLVCLTALLIYARRVESRRRRDAEKFSETASALTSRVHALEQQLKALTEITSALASRVQNLFQGHSVGERKEVPADAVIQASSAEKTPQAKSIPASGSVVPAIPVEVARPPQAAPPATTPPVAQPSTAALAAQVASALAQKAAAASAGATAVPPAGSQAPSARLQAPTSVPFQSLAARSASSLNIPRAIKPKLTLETIGTKWLPKVGITILVLGVALYTASKWENIPPIARILLFYLLGAGLLGLGIFLERKEKYRILGRVLIGGGWAISFFTTYAMRHVEAASIIRSDVLDLFLMLAVAAAMVWHTLRYNSQLVTGVSFLLGFAAVSVSHETAFSMTAGAILAVGLAVLVVRRQWFELEVFGILASYLNHFYWLYETFLRLGHHPFSGYWSSVSLMGCYWATFRTSYLVRKVKDKHQESISTVAALLNALLFLGVMKYQSFHPEWAFYALLILGAVEFTLGQLPVSRRRLAPFQILSSLGATLMVVAIPFKYAGRHTLEMLWMAGAEVFLLAGVLTKERLFRQFGGIISFLVAGYLFAWPPNDLIHLVQRVINGQPHHDAQLGLVLAVVAGFFYVNSHVIARVWSGLFDRMVEQQAISALSFVASVLAVGAIYASAGGIYVAVCLAVFVTALSWTGKQLRVAQLLYQAHWIALVAIIDVCINAIHLDAFWHSVPERVITLGTVAALLYLSSNFVQMELPGSAEIFVVLYRWAGTALITLAIWLQTWFAVPRRDWLIALLWTALALVLAGVAQLLERNEFRWQAFTLAMMSFACALWLNFEATQEFHRLTYRLISVTLIAGGIYLLARWSPLARIKPAYSWAGTILLGYLAYRETQTQYQVWTAVLWIALAAVLGLAVRLWKDRSLLWQTHLLSAAATVWTVVITFQSYHDSPAHLKAMLIAVSLTSAVLYALTWITNIAGVVESDRIWQAYSWAGSLLLTWLAWYQLQPISVSLAWGAFALVLFELGYNARSSYLRMQAYLALACSFAHLFYSNFNTLLPAGTFDPHILLIVLLAPIYFLVYWRLHTRPGVERMEQRLQIEYLLACLGTATVAALARFEIPAESVVTGYASLVLVLLLIAWRTRLQVFLHQALVLLGMTAFRLVMHNFRNLQSSFVSTLPSSLWAIALLLAGLPVAFKLRSQNETMTGVRRWIEFLLRRPEQPLFFACVGLMAALLWIRMRGMTLTLAWCIEGIAVILAAFFVKEKGFLWTGLLLVLFCSGKIFVDLAHVDASVRYLAMMGVGAIILVAGYLFAKNRDALREYL